MWFEAIGDFIGAVPFDDADLFLDSFRVVDPGVVVDGHHFRADEGAGVQAVAL